MDVQKEVRHTLKVPVNFEGKEHTYITLRRIKGKDLRAITREEDKIEQTFLVIRLLSSWPPEGIDELDGEDIEAISKIIEGFMGKRARR
ncbi:phage tail assembly protein [Escherichia coli]|uniref:phage tail assembly protein n=1 Tax=Escherichia coli TaxID=562 RepID=UPI003CFDCE62